MNIMMLIRRSIKARFSESEKLKISQKQETVITPKFDELYKDNEDLGFC